MKKRRADIALYEELNLESIALARALIMDHECQRERAHGCAAAREGCA